MLRVAHLTSVHPRVDTRIFVKECRSLTNAGYQVDLIVADGLGPDECGGVTLNDVGCDSGRFSRLLKTVPRMYRYARSLNAAVYHLHDPELLPVGLLLRWKGYKVIFDSHEDVPKQILSKHYIRPILRRSLSAVYGALERFIVRRLSAVVCATDLIESKFRTVNSVTVTVNNYPSLSEFNAVGSFESKCKSENKIASPEQPYVCYVGALTATRGASQFVQALIKTQSNARLLLGGKFADRECESECKADLGWAFVDELGFLNREQVIEVMRRSTAGLVTLQPTPSYVESVPVKMFEYMAAGLPLIASDFPYWRKLLEGIDCAYFVDPLNPSEIARAIDQACADYDRNFAMGQAGRRAVEEKFNWAVEEEKLLNLYAELLN